MRRLFLVLALFAVVQSGARACSCARESGDFAEQDARAFATHKYVVLAELGLVTRVAGVRPPETVAKSTFRVVESFKGGLAVGEVLNVELRELGDTCDFPLVTGRTYRLFLTAQRVSEVDLDGCSHSRESWAGETNGDLRALGRQPGNET